MDAASDRRRERLVALAILAVAVVLAAWITHRPAPIAQLPLPLPSPSAPPTVADLGALMAPVEVVELPPSVAAPPPAPASTPKSAPQAAPAAPPSPPQQIAATPPPPPAPPQPAAKPEPAPEPQRIETPPPEPTVTPLKPAPVAPPPPLKTVEPLHLEPQRNVEAPAVKPLKPEPPPVRAKAPDLPKPLAHKAGEAPEPALPPPLKPTQPDDNELAAFRAARDQAKAIEPLKPEPLPKPAPPPVETARPVAPPSPPPMPDIKPLAPEPPKTLMVKAEPPPPKPRAPVPAPAPSPPPAPPPRAAAPQPTIASGNVGEGRALLRMLEQGSGPGIEIGWPGDAGARDRLYRLLTQCFGMRVGVLDTENKLYMAEGQPGEPSEFNTDRYSGFVRRPEGAMAADEQHEVTRLRGYHHVATAASIRVFPRRVDAFLISGLRQAVGENYLGLKSIRAIYRVNGQRVTVDTISADGHTVPGIIDLSAVSSGCAE